MKLDDLTEERNVGTEEIIELLKGKNVIFIVVEREAEWIPKNESLDFWRDKVKIRVPLDVEYICLEDYPDEYCYVPIKCRNNKDINDLTCYIKLLMYH
jgi:hypothetical protein